MTDFDFNSIEKAYKIIKDEVIKTPLITNEYINDQVEGKIFFKLENLQKTGSFKYRGASHKIAKLNETQKQKGIVAYSSGNHAQAVAYASHQQNISAKIIMPKNAPKIKIENTKKYNAEVILYDPAMETRESIGQKITVNENRAIIRPYDDYDIIAGQGTAGKEIACRPM